MNEPSNPPAYVQPPSPCRMVMVFDATTSRREPAVITRVHGPTCVNVQVLPDCEKPYCLTSLSLIEPGESRHGWYWPPRV